MQAIGGAPIPTALPLFMDTGMLAPLLLAVAQQAQTSETITALIQALPPPPAPVCPCGTRCWPSWPRPLVGAPSTAACSAVSLRDEPFPKIPRPSGTEPVAADLCVVSEQSSPA